MRIRTITAGRTIGSLQDTGVLEEELAFLSAARDAFAGDGLEVQTVRIATQPILGTAAGENLSLALRRLRRIESLMREAHALIAVGPVGLGDYPESSIADWAADLIAATSNLSFSVSIASPERGIDPRGHHLSARIMLALASVLEGGEANFRFAAAANIPAGTPFFPVAVHAGKPAFSLGLESARLVEMAFDGATDPSSARSRLVGLFEERLQPVVALAREIARQHSRRFLGIDMSPAPGLDASIALAIEKLTGLPFGSPSTLGACSTITHAIQETSIPRCGYSGLMLPVLEDLRLAQRAAEGRFTLNDLLLYSAICGTGLDVVPLPGDIALDHLAAIIGDVAALSHRLRKPLAARLLPIPGKQAGEVARFDNPYLTEAPVMGSPDPAGDFASGDILRTRLS